MTNITKKNIAKKNIFCFWTGKNEMSDARKKCLQNMNDVCGCDIVFLTYETIPNYILSEYPLHEGYQYLSETHKADYLRIYFMHHHGGGYSDIKFQTGSWIECFDKLNNSDNWVCGYKEVPGGVAEQNRELCDKWYELVGNGAYIFKPYSPITTEYIDQVHIILDSKLEKLKTHPATYPQDCVGSGSGYPIEWNEICGRIFHRVAYKYKDKVMNTLPTPLFHSYR